MRMRTRFARLLLAALAAAPVAFGAAAADAASWRLDPGKSRLGFTGVQTGSPFSGRFTKYGATIAFDPAHLDASHISVTVDLASAATGDVQRDSALPGKDWFDVAQFPQARFETTAIRHKAGNAYEAAGNLTLRGVTRAVVLPFTLDISGAAAHAKGRLDLSRTAFGVGQGTWATGQWVALAVGVDLDIVAVRAS